jgi:hypothetical protein
VAGGIFCIENWSGDFRSKDSSSDLLAFLEKHGAARTIHQRVSATRELGHYLSRFASQTTYRVGYLAMHGSRGKVYVGTTPVSLETLINWSTMDGEAAPRLSDTGEPEEYVVDLVGKVLYLGSCASLNVSPERLATLREETGAVAVCGYRRSVDWFEAAGFELLLLPALAASTAGERQTVGRALQRLWKRSGTLMSNLGFISEPNYDPN